METFVQEYLINAHPKAKLINTPDESIFILICTEGLNDDIRLATQTNDLAYREFNWTYIENEGKIKVTFDSETANFHKSLEFINVNHPLIKCIKRYYDKNRNQLFPCAQIRLSSTDFNTGEYFYFVYLLEFTGAKPEKRIEYIAIDRKTRNRIESDIAERIINQAKTSGVNYDYTGFLKNDELSAVYRLSDRMIHDYQMKKQAELSKINDRRINDRIANLKNSFNFKIDKITDRLNKATNENIKKMHEGHLRNVKNSFNEKLKSAEYGRGVESSIEEVAAGYINITKE